MNKKVLIVIISILLLIVVVVIANSFNTAEYNSEAETQETVSQIQSPAKTNDIEAQQQVQTSTEPSNPSSAPGVYITYDEFNSNKEPYKDSTVVYFFNAKWCPTCQALTKDITASVADIPDNMVIVSVDYDKFTDLKKQYGVTIQHTLVQVDASGNAIQKWSGGNTLDSIVSKV